MNTATARASEPGGRSRLTEQVKAYGCPEPVCLTDEPTPGHIEYLDLLPDRSPAPLLPEAVAESQGRPVIYLLDEETASEARRHDAKAVQRLQQLLANRSEQACLGIVRPGQLDVYPINLDRKQLAAATPRVILESAPGAPTFFQSLAAGAVPLKGQPKEADFVFQEIHDLLTRASDELAGKMEPLEVLSVTGRALFFRFLLDRRIIQDSERERGEICPPADELKDCFSNAEKAAATSCWLDETFNGDLLPLAPHLPFDADAEQRREAYAKLYNRMGADTGNKVFLHLQAILRGWESLPGSTFQLRIDWDDLNFAHIPIGVLSQVYETFSHQWDEKHAKKTSVYYTPKNIARILVEEAFGGLKALEDAKVLDPACGAGTFLVLALRRIVRARWEKDGQRPDTKTIQRILYNQLCGFDVSVSALRLAALALYITAIELNKSPRPPRSLRFPGGLQGQVLFNFAPHDDEHRKGFVLGSLGPQVPSEINGAFDVVMGNPPWTRLRLIKAKGDDEEAEKKRLAALNREFTAITNRALNARGLAEIANDYTNPDNNPDLPFIWRATEWARPNGIIAMALHGRILLKQTEQGKTAREALIRGLEITGIINGSNLSDTDVWPEMNQPFMLFFARNAVPPPDYHFYFATPVLESQLNDRGLFRIDYQAAQPVAASAIMEKPWLLKTLAIGTSLDIEVMDRLTSPEWKTIGKFWSKPALYSGQGYNLSPGLKQYPANHLFTLPDFKEPEGGFSIPRGLKTWHTNHPDGTAHMPRNERLYRPPLVIVPKSPGEGRLQPKSFRSRSRAICFSLSYYGFSAAGHPEAEVLVSLLYLITHSLLFQYFCLVVSSSIGAERRMFIKMDLESFPFPDPEKLTAAQKRRILALAEALETRSTKPWEGIDELIFELYGLDEDDATVVRDTLAVGAPYQAERASAERPPDAKEREIFLSYLEEMLQPSFGVVGQRVRVELVRPTGSDWDPVWRFLSIALKGDELPVTEALIRSLMNEANKAAASRVVMRVPEGGLLLGILNQRRFWTRSRARLCGIHLLRNYLDAFPIEAKR